MYSHDASLLNNIVGWYNYIITNYGYGLIVAIVKSFGGK